MAPRLSATERRLSRQNHTRATDSLVVRHDSAQCERSGQRRNQDLIFQIDPDTGIGGWEPRRCWQDSLWAAPFVGLAELARDLRHRRLSTADWIFLFVVVSLITRG